jgi:hypothetical protein
MELTIFNIFQAFKGLTWPDLIDLSEDKFNKNKLYNLLKSVPDLSDIEMINEKDIRRNAALPFFGWGASRENLDKIDAHVTSDLSFKKGEINLLIENKLVRDDKNEDSIKNALVQTIEYLNLYNVSGAILLVFDDGRAKKREWENNPEEHLIKCLTSKYPFCVVRIRKDKRTCVYFN